MDRLGAWLWQRHRERFIGLLWIIVSGGLAITLIPPSTASGALFLDISAGETIIWTCSVTATLLVAAVVTYVSSRRVMAPLRRYVRGDDVDLTAAWRTMVSLPQMLGFRALIAIVPLSLAGSLPVVLTYADLGPPGVVTMVYSYLVVCLSGVTLLTIGAQLLIEAPAMELSARLGVVDAPVSGWWTIRRRLLSVMYVSTTFAGVTAAGAVLGTSATENDFAVVFLLSAVVSAYLLLLMDNGVFRPTVKPVQRLIDAVVRVRRGDLSTPVPVITADELGHLSAAFNEMQAGLRDRAALHAAFGSYVDPVLAERLLASGSSLFEGEDVVVTALFADVRDFTSFSERVAPSEAVAVLNRLFDVIVPALQAHGGHANHYLGDGLLAVFGAPQPLERHADAAVAAAIEMQRRARNEFGSEVRVGIGINTGPVIAGTVGGGGRHEFTVIGDTVNVAARVEALSKNTGDSILITAATRTALSSPRPRSTKRGAFDLRGKSAKVTVYAVNPFPRSSP